MIGEPVGREREIAIVDAFLARPDATLRALVLVGEPGIGKSTLWHRAVETGRERGLSVLASRPAEPERELANVVLGDLLVGVPASAIETLPGARRRAIEAALLTGDRASAPEDPRALGVAVATVVGSMADDAGLVIAIDDDQWMDAASAESLAFALRRLGDRPIRLLLARRTHDEPVVALEGAMDSAAVERLEVRPLSLGATQLLIRERLGVSLSRPALRELHRVSGGNPFHALELARERSRAPARDLELPLAAATVDALVRARLGALDGDVIAAARLVAANGRAQMALLDALGIGPEVIDRAVDAGVLERSSHIVGFTHPLLAAAAYEMAGAEGRRRAHRSLAEAIPDPVKRGRHAALGAEGPSRPVSAELERAVGIARERGEPVTAADLAERAIELTPADDADDRHRRTMIAARARLEAGDGEHARVLLSSVLDNASGSRRAEALVIASDVETAPDAVSMLTDALGLAGSDPRLRATIHARLASIGRLTRGRDWAERHARASLRLAEWVGEDGLRARALSIVGLLRYEDADPDGLDLVREAYRLGLAAGDGAAARDAATNIGHILTWSHDPTEARSWLVEQLSAWADRDELIQANWLWYLALVELRAGRWDEADARNTASAEIWALYDIELPQDHLPPALSALYRGEFGLARRHSERALAISKGMRIPTHLSVLATVALWSGELERSIVAFEQADAAADARGFREPAMRPWRVEYGEALVRAGRIDDAERLVEDWEPIAIRVGRVREIAAATYVRGLIATARSDLDGAIALLDLAAARYEAIADRFGWARSRLAAGVVQLRLRQKRLAREAFGSAAEAFAALGASSWLAETRAELGRIGGRARIEGLSPSERRVAELVADGRSNREIATALFVTERTVASHLTHVYAKLGVTSRTQLAGVLAAESRGKVPTS